MARTADKPGKYRIRLSGGEWLLSGIRNDGRRVKMRFSTEDEARGIAGNLFPTPKLSVSSFPVNNLPVDDWGVPLTLDDTTINAVADAIGVTPESPEIKPDAKEAEKEAKEEEKKSADAKKRSRSLCEFAGVGWAAGTVFTARKLTEWVDKEPVNPSPKQVCDLRDSVKDTLIEWFGDAEIKPWQMAILLTLALPVSMVLQSPKKKHPLPSEEVSQQETPARPDLKSV